MHLLALLALATQDAPSSRVMFEHAAAVVCMAAAPDRSVIFVAGGAETRAWDLKENELRWSVETKGVQDLDAGEERLALCNGSNSVQLLDVESGAEKERAVAPVGIISSNCVALDPKSRWVWLGTGAATRLVPGSKETYNHRPLENRGVTTLAMDAKAKLLAAGGRDGSVRFVGAKSASIERKKVIEGDGASISAVVLDPRGTLVVAGSQKGGLRVWKVSNCKLAHELQSEGAVIAHLEIDAKGKLLASGDVAGVVKLWDLKKGELLASWRAGLVGITGLAFVDKGEGLLTAARAAKQVTRWDLTEL